MKRHVGLLLLASTGTLFVLATSTECQQEVVLETDGRVVVEGECFSQSALLNKSQIDHGKAMIDWLRREGGFVHDGIEVRHFNNDPDAPYGLYTTLPLNEHEIILSIPAHTTVNAEGTDEICDTARNLHQALEDSSSSFYAPYVNYLIDTQSFGQLPCVWSDAGQDILIRMLQNGNLPPFNPVGWSFLDHCDVQKEEEFAFQMVRQRGWDDILIPLYDMMSHGNGEKWINTVCDQVQGAPRIDVRASRNIAAGEELFCSYTQFPGSDDLHQWYGTPEIFRDFGFVERFPQRWIFDTAENFMTLAFELDTTDNDEWKVSWLRNVPSAEDIQYAKKMVEALKTFGQKELEFRDPAVSSNEWNALLEYHAALTFALEAAIAAPTEDDFLEEANEDAWYDDLKEEAGSLLYNHGDYTCDAGQTHEFLGYEPLEVFYSHYQELSFDSKSDTNDCCFSLDDIVQMCSSYRAHHHEVSVHYSARYLDSVKRVVWIGGGDSMLLYEILKYPDLELVIGLELDQKVTRYNFKHMGTQPHFDDDKVEWWYGDATKSLQMLPKEYFGSFDLVLVDLSDTVMDLSVTSNLDIFGAVAMLLNENGVMVKNELYLEQFSRVFHHTLQIHYYDVPVICSQSFILGSFNVDFLNRKPKDHGIIDDTIFMKLRSDTTNRFDIFHDYRRNVTREDALCMTQEKAHAAPVEQTASPGILMILEVEDTTVDLDSTETLKDILVNSIVKVGLGVIKTIAPASNKRMIGVVLKEGFILARTFPEHKYCAFDLHLWGSYEKQEIAKKALINALGSDQKSTSSSSYRIVAGGMFGVDTWVKDEDNRGPRYVHPCRHKQEQSRGPFTNHEAVNSITLDLLSLIHQKGNITVAILCGREKDSCDSLKSISKSPNVRAAIPIWTCTDIDDGFDRQVACEKTVQNILQTFVEDDGGELHSIIVDPAAPFAMGQILHKIFSDAEDGLDISDVLSDQFLLIAHSLDVRETWRRALLDRFRRDIISTDPTFRAEVLLNSTDSSMELGVVSSGDSFFLNHFHHILQIIEEKIGVVAETRNIQGANFTFQPDFEPSLFFPPDVYDQSEPLKQWNSQHPIGFQTVSQLEMGRLDQVVSVGEIVGVFFPDEKNWYPATVLSFHPEDGSADVRYIDDSKTERRVVRRRIRRTASAISRAMTRKSVEPISLERLQDAIKFGLTSIAKYLGVEETETHTFDNIAEGALFISFWSSGSASILWDGRRHIDINLFTYTESVEAADEFLREFIEQIPLFSTVLRDDHPRGYGRVVNYARDIKTGGVPNWAAGF